MYICWSIGSTSRKFCLFTRWPLQLLGPDYIIKDVNVWESAHNEKTKSKCGFIRYLNLHFWFGIHCLKVPGDSQKVFWYINYIISFERATQQCTYWLGDCNMLVHKSINHCFLKQYIYYLDLFFNFLLRQFWTWKTYM